MIALPLRERILATYADPGRPELNAILPLTKREAKAFAKARPDWQGYEDLLVDPPAYEAVKAEYGKARRAALERDPGFLVLFVRGMREGGEVGVVSMLAAQCGPVLKGETAYAGTPAGRTLLQQFGGDEKMLARYVKAWRDKGREVTGYETWLAHLANGKDDVECLASPGDALSTMKRVAEQRNIPLEGAVNVKHRNDAPPEPETPLAHDIVTAIAREEAKTDPSFLRTEETKRAKYHEIVEKHSFKLD